MYLGFSPGSVWVSNYASPYLWRIDAASGTIAQRLLIGYGAQGVEDDGSKLWVAMYKTGFVLQVDRATGAIRKRFQVDGKPRGVTIALGSVWVANSASDTISRIALSRCSKEPITDATLAGPPCALDSPERSRRRVMHSYRWRRDG